MQLSHLTSSKLVKQFQSRGAEALQSHPWETLSQSHIMQDEQMRDRLVVMVDQGWDYVAAQDNDPKVDNDPREGSISMSHPSGGTMTFEYEGDVRGGQITRTYETVEGAENRMSVSVTRYAPDCIDKLNIDVTNHAEHGLEFVTRANQINRSGPITVFDRVVLETRNESVLDRP
jgi:hypothetical protein